MAYYNLTGNFYRPLTVTDNLFCGGNLQLMTDNLLVVGGDDVDTSAQGVNNGLANGLYNIRVYNTLVTPPTYTIVATMSGGRWCVPSQSLCGSCLWYCTLGPAARCWLHAFWQCRHAGHRDAPNRGSADHEPHVLGDRPHI